jgi:two-component system cell cycle sensor histidine kinase/response regulator CckA
MLNPGILIALVAAAVNLSMAALHCAIARAPGWRIARVFAGMALTACIYDILNIVYCVAGLSDAVYLAAGRISYLVATVQGVLWLVYAYSDGASDGDRSLHSLPKAVRWIAVSAVMAGLVLGATGWLFSAHVDEVPIAWAGITYYYPVTTALGDAYAVLVLLLPGAAILHLAGRVRRGERTLRWQLGLFTVVFLFAVEEMLVAERMLNFPSLLDVGFLLLMVPFSWQFVDRVISDARKLRDLSEHLETNLLRRTDERDQVRKALLDAESKISDLVASLDAIVWEADAPTLEVTFVSEGVSRLLGYSPGQLEKQPGAWHSYVHPDDRERVLASTRAAVRSNSKVSLEYRMLSAEGQVHWVRDYVHPVGNSSTRPARLRGIIVDVTESRRAHEALLQSEERFRSLFENATVGIYRTTPDGRILIANPALISLLGFSSFEQLANRNLEQEGFEPGYPRSHFRQLLESQGVVAGLEVIWTRLDGSVVFVRESARAVRSDDGAVLYYDGIVEDFTQRKRAEEALRESEARFRNIADTCPVIIWCGNPDRQITFLNKEAANFSGRNLDELLLTGWKEQVHPDDLSRLEVAISSTVSGRHSFQTEYRLRRHDGEYRWVLDTAVSRFVGEVYAGYTGSVVDITDLKRNQERVLATQKLESLGVLASGIAHDFNNMLGAIFAQSELALSELPAGSSAAEEIDSIKTVSLRAAEIVHQLLAYAGEEGTGFEPVDLSRLVGEMLQLLGVSISKQSVLTTELAENLPAILASAPQLRQMVLNLITNASEAFGEDGGVITVRTARICGDPVALSGTDLSGRDYVRLEVSDNGCGMSEEVQARIFDPFFTTKFAGRGLGLAAAQGIVRRHGGAIKVVSAPGQGTRFEVFLPSVGICDVPVVSSAGQDETAIGVVLMVEDEESLRIPASKMLRAKGFSVLEAGDGYAAVDLFRVHQADIDVVLIDLTLPGLGGKEVLTEIRRIRPGVKVVLTTAYSEEMVANTIDGRHDWAFIRKPYQITDLTHLLRTVLSPTCP